MAAAAPVFNVLLTGPVMPMIERQLSACPLLRVHKLHEISDPESFIDFEGAGVRGLVVSYAGRQVDGAFMARFPRLEVVSVLGVGYDKVDARWAGEHGIVVTNTPDVLTDEVADLSLGLLVATVRRLPQADRFVREGRWTAGNFPLTGSLQGKRLGLLGMGRIGRAIAQRAEAFRLRISYHSRTPRTDVPYTYVPSLLELAGSVDILLVIAPGGDATRGIVSRAVLARLGPKGCLINVSRGSLVDEDALVELLRSGQLGSAGLDVFVNEPHVPEALLALENVVLLPHVGSASVETRDKMGQLVVDNVIAFARGDGPLTPVVETPWPPR
jgi:lactate dehydrogenase-like 2-hydroxyacid dehydrogenase